MKQPWDHKQMIDKPRPSQLGNYSSTGCIMTSPPLEFSKTNNTTRLTSSLSFTHTHVSRKLLQTTIRARTVAPCNGITQGPNPNTQGVSFSRDPYIIHLNIALYMVVSLYFGGKSHRLGAEPAAIAWPAGPNLKLDSVYVLLACLSGCL